MQLNIKELFNKPHIVGIIGNADSGKSNLLYSIIDQIKGYAKIRAFGLRKDIKSVHHFNSIKELEEITNSAVIIDEYYTLFDLENRKNKSQIEQILRLIFHNNNVVW